MSFAGLSLVLLSLSLPVAQERPTCATWADCREHALAAAEAQEYERFHDYAWLAVQKGRRNDPELMLLLARAQSLSGRPLDALVMLRRLAELGVAVDAAASDDFRRVRVLPGWADLERQLAGVPPPPAPEAPRMPPSSPARAPGSGVAGAPAAAPEPAPAAPEPAARGRGSEFLRFRTSAFTPAGLAYDRVSRRFIVGDRDGQRLAVVDEFSHQVTTLAGSKGPGFGTVAALEIDARDGTLWVVSNTAGGGRLHKLQLISARALAGMEAPEPEASRFVDLSLGAAGQVFVLDAAARRILRLRGTTFPANDAIRLGDRVPRSLAPATGAAGYVAHADGLARVEFDSGRVADVKAPTGVPLTGLVRVRWHDRALVAIQEVAGGYRAVRLRLGRDGLSVTSFQVLDDGIETADPSASSVVGDTLYYLAQNGDGAIVIRQVSLR